MANTNINNQLLCWFLSFVDLSICDVCCTSKKSKFNVYPQVNKWQCWDPRGGWAQALLAENQQRGQIDVVRWCTPLMTASVLARLLAVTHDRNADEVLDGRRSCSIKPRSRRRRNGACVPSAGRQDTITHGHYHHTRTAGQQTTLRPRLGGRNNARPERLIDESPSLENAHTRQSAPEKHSMRNTDRCPGEKGSSAIVPSSQHTHC
ncbi:hypothetical protein THAOC_33656 [Thalassiosira oceanica]|uniref:Secreted protein n=1 Tax=Thalassiosira oceanica TaxID=159749 RepID=K0R4Q4_THAOC|nr:hypothetical protein THAOC_33656 [Thalassiosira oceanica]|eukprot:EJK47610.1 hypothetical protein THAOC_33656 [Thalassiosira oceanica]